MWNAMAARLPFGPDALVLVPLVAAVFTMVVPLPAAVLDGLLAVSLASGVLLLAVAFFLSDPVEFTAFPAVVQISTVFRLGLSVATTRLVLLEGEAGDIVRTFGDLAVGGSVAVGLVVFLIVAVVQFVVITKGAERIAEVGARFSLDAMPHAQMAIAQDLQSGSIDAREAARRRLALQRGYELRGAMDGAMRFVKGDAVAGLVIIAVNLLGGLAVGVLQHGMSAAEAARTYSMLTVGDGLVAQIPALFTAVAAGVMVTRVRAAAEGDGLGREVAAQLSADPRALAAAAVVVGLLGLVPGFPWPAFALVSAGLAASAWARRGAAPGASAAGEAAARSDAPGALPLGAAAPGGERVRLLLGPDLAQTLVLPDLKRRLSEVSAALSEEHGIPISAPVLAAGRRTGSPGGSRFLLELEGAHVARGALPTGGTPACVDLLVGEVEAALRRHAAVFVSVHAVTGRMLEVWGSIRVATVGRAMLGRDDPSAVVVILTEVLRRLSDEGVRNFDAVCDVLSRHSLAHKLPSDPAELAEIARRELRPQICARWADDDGVIRAFLFVAEPEIACCSGEARDGGHPAGDSDPLDEAVDDLARRIREEGAAPQVRAPVVLTAGRYRGEVRSRLRRRGVHFAVLELEDIGPGFRVEPIGPATGAQVATATVEDSAVAALLGAREDAVSV